MVCVLFFASRNHHFSDMIAVSHDPVIYGRHFFPDQLSTIGCISRQHWSWMLCLVLWNNITLYCILLFHDLVVYSYFIYHSAITFHHDRNGIRYM
jgi:hypothetical protein